MPSPLTTHALDTSTGTPAAGLELQLSRIGADDAVIQITTSSCDKDGRVKDLISNSSQWLPGVYRLRFQTQKYFSSKEMPCFYPHCDVTFTVDDVTAHYHVPLLFSPFGFTSYRGS